LEFGKSTTKALSEWAGRVKAGVRAPYEMANVVEMSTRAGAPRAQKGGILAKETIG
jgi:hypothetical protein